jgi:2-isopropylmalate synthase
VLANPLTYEIMTPESVGLPKNKMILGKHSGKHAFESRLAELGFLFTPEKITDLFVLFKALADRKKTVTDTDIEAMARDVLSPYVERIKLKYFNVLASNAITPMSTVRLIIDGKEVEQVAAGDGPINASFAAINKLVGTKAVLETYKLNATTGGANALGEVDVSVREGDRLARGHGSSTDVIEASIRAYLHALNILSSEKADNSSIKA